MPIFDFFFGHASAEMKLVQNGKMVYLSLDHPFQGTTPPYTTSHNYTILLTGCNLKVPKTSSGKTQKDHYSPHLTSNLVL